MTNAKHTPGAWKVSENKTRSGCAAKVVSIDKGYVVAEAFSSPSANIKYKDLWGEAEANARLIAAAPELMVALEGLLSSPNSNLHHNVARAAIAKAKGE